MGFTAHVRQIVTGRVDAAWLATSVASDPVLRIRRRRPGLSWINVAMRPAGWDQICRADLPGRGSWDGQATRVTPSAMPMSKGSAAVSRARRSLPR